MSDPHLPDAKENRAKAAGVVTPVSDGRLVLTPALRVTDGPDGSGAAKTADPSPVDDAALRAIVQEILREELAGPLGERMTRAVRRLVRTEVATLLAARDID